MQRSFGLQISDLETIQSGVKQELTLEEAEKIVGGSVDIALKIPEKRKDIIVDIIVPPCTSAI